MTAIAEDVPKAICFLKSISEVSMDLSTAVKNITAKVENLEYDSSKGLSFLDLKCHLMLNYLVDMCYLVLRKCNGYRIEGDPSIIRLVENRTVLEKMRPIEQMLKYHIDKLIKVSAGAVSEMDPLSHRANPQNLISKIGDDQGEEEVDSETDDIESQPKAKGQMKAYVPPKLAAVPYDGDDGNEAKELRKLEQARKRALSSTIMRELKAEYFEGPEEIRDVVEAARRRESKEAKHKREYEEEYMTRLPVTKKSKAAEKRHSAMSGLDGLANFGDTSFLTSDDKEGGFGLPQKKPRMTKKGKKSGSKKSKGGKRFKKGKRK